MSAITLSPPPVETAPTPRPARAARPRALVVAGKIAMALLVCIVVSSCARRAPTPTSYGGNNSTIEKNFISGCTGKSGHAGDAASSSTTCHCEWTAIKKQIPFADFKTFYSGLTNKPGPLPTRLLDIVNSCN